MFYFCIQVIITNFRNSVPIFYWKYDKIQTITYLIVGEIMLYIQNDEDKNKDIITTRKILIERVQQMVKKSPIKYSIDDFIAGRHQESINELH